MADQARPTEANRIVIVTGPAGSGRSTAIGAFEDLGFEAIDNLPISLLPRLFSGDPVTRPLVVGIDPRNREFSVHGVIEALVEIWRVAHHEPVLVFLKCDESVLIQRYSETRRRHPLSPEEPPTVGIDREIVLLGPLQAHADVLIDTSKMTPHDLRAEVRRLFGTDAGESGLSICVQSFSYKRGIPRSADMVIDVRFLRNPHWEPALRLLTGQAVAVQEYVAKDPLFAEFYDKLSALLTLLLPAYQAEGKSYFTLCVGCTGGKHRSVAIAERLAEVLREANWHVSLRHRDLERAALAAGSGA